MKKWLSLRAFAQELGVSPFSVRTWIRKGELEVNYARDPDGKIEQDQPRLRSVDLERFQGRGHTRGRPPTKKE